MSNEDMPSKTTKPFKRKGRGVTIYDTSLYETAEDMKIMNQVKDPALALDFILERRFAQAVADDRLDEKEKQQIHTLLNKEFTKDTDHLPEPQKKKVQKIKRKLRKQGAKIRYPNLGSYFK
jgi:hypothetical protein